MEIVLGIDQGASKTLAVAADAAGKILSTGIGPGANQAITGPEAAAEIIEAAVADALSKAGKSLKDVKAIGAGICGLDFPAEHVRMKAALEKRFRVPAAVMNDVMASLRAEYAGSCAMVICPGSGSNIGVRDRFSGEHCIGYYLDDGLQGGDAIGRAALRYLFDAELGLEDGSGFSDAVLRYFGMRTADELQEWYFTCEDAEKGAKVRGLVPLLDELAEAQVPGAVRLLTRFSEGTGRYAAAMMEKYQLSDTERKVYFSGGVFKAKIPVLKETIKKMILEANPKACFFDAEYEPVLGGTVLAEELIHGKLPEGVEEQLKKSAAEFGLRRKG